jgi:hypothetical protein
MLFLFLLIGTYKIYFQDVFEEYMNLTPIRAAGGVNDFRNFEEV